jgi:hypothetical protein
MKPPITLAVIVATLLTSLLAAASDTDQVPAANHGWPVDLTGIWNLDTARSDDLATQIEKIREQAMAPRGGRGRGMGGGRGGGMSGDRPSGKGAPPSDAPGAPSPRDLARRCSQLLISRLDDSLEIVDGAELTHLWNPDGHPYTERTPRGESTTRAWWEDAVLCLERKDGPMTVTQRLRLHDGGQTLAVSYTMALPTGDTVTGRLIYRGV